MYEKDGKYPILPGLDRIAEVRCGVLKEHFSTPGRVIGVRHIVFNEYFYNLVIEL